MARVDKWGEETWHVSCCRKLYESGRLCQEDKDWVDKMFTKSTLKLSEEERLDALYKEMLRVNKIRLIEEDVI